MMMNNNKTKKDLRAEYDKRPVKGGVFAIKNTGTGRMLVDSTADMRGSANRFDFMKKTDYCPNPKLQKDWTGSAAPFEFEIIEELEKGDAQTDAEFKSDLRVLKELWLEKLSGADLYN
jgi:hypothetical protein